MVGPSNMVWVAALPCKKNSMPALLLLRALCVGVLSMSLSVVVFCMQSFVSERSVDQDLGCIDRFSCNLDDMLESVHGFGFGTYSLCSHLHTATHVA